MSKDMKYINNYINLLDSISTLKLPVCSINNELNEKFFNSNIEQYTTKCNIT